MGAVPKRKISTQRKGRRRKDHRAKSPALVICQHCGEMKRPHRVCLHCDKY